MQIYVHKNNQQLGPYSEAEIRAQLAAGTITLQEHVWWQGQATWLPLGQTSLVTPAAAPLPRIPAVPLPVHPATMGAIPVTSQLAIWSLACGCLSLFCSLVTAIPAVILGHLSLAEINKTPGLQGRGMALAGTIIGYIYIVLVVAAMAVIIALGNQVKQIFSTLGSQMAQSQASSSDDSSTNSDPSTNAPDQTTPTNSPDQSTNSDSSTNTPTATPMNR